MPASNGGMVVPLNVEFVLEGFSVAGVQIFYFDPTNFNDPNSPSNYSWKVEEILPGRTPSCTRQIITYRDLGVVGGNPAFPLTATLSGYDQNAKAIVSVSQNIILGTVAATHRLCTTTPDVLSLNLSAMNLQFSITRAAGAGPLSIAKVRLEGTVEFT